ncbi:aminotransferase class V-fold PLP-dependent enzyme [Burkholderia pseudomallei]|uniref:aminotransferase class V-fold PLP-dependent enzyme n=1 Tax=Burkholderia pseudomallei TaxID=28450 RepID=UPI00097692A0|nr:aminotransferase class V-fold PLP-dependent enzyme [Burkholderia pseudomallei]OND01800.1 cysteine desulfurase [Burkholderia pseudomallei]OND04363.1 cysteine desulfurase [Burkholderia pseudomallei]OND09409.1 cysteine desulfurase [Burkholderia pseudomallei]OND13317.1 cysteine desulfurase [Burkholderia pseudomallei]OND15170.1 cysteine desulfurase [Burkholderia pseudomallei]
MGDMLRSATMMASAFPALAQRVNGAPLAYLDNAATTHVPQPVLAAMRGFDERDRANIHRGVHTLSQRATDAYERARDTLARFVGANGEHLLVFTSGTTDALNLVANGLSVAGHTQAVLQEGDEIIVSALEHHANLVPWQMAARRCGAKLRILHPDPQGSLHVLDLERLLGPRTRVFAVTACSNATGERPPYEALLAAARAGGALTVLDAAQAVGHDVPDLSALACDFAAFSGHKMYGPMGTGALVGRRDALERLVPLRFGGDMVSWVGETDATFDALPARLEGGTPNVAGAVGIAAAADYIDAIGRARIDAHVRALRDHAAAGLAALDGVTVLAPRTSSAIVSFVVDGVHPHDIGTLLDERGIAVRTGFHCAQPLLERLGCGPTTRASFALYNTHDEVERLVAGVAQALKVLR